MPTQPERPSTGISTTSQEAFTRLHLAELALAEADALRDTAAKERDAAQAELVRLGREEGWHL